MISLAKSTGTWPLGMPSSWTRPPRRTAANAWCRAEGTPDISHTTSAPSPPVSASTARTTSSRDRKSTRLNSSYRCISYAVFCLKKKKINADKNAEEIESRRADQSVYIVLGGEIVAVFGHQGGTENQ